MVVYENIKVAIFHAHAQVISRGHGRNVVAASAYRSASRLFENILDPKTGIYCTRIWNYSRKTGVALSKIFAPKDSPHWATSREELWNYVEHFERRKDAQLAREFDIALPVELTKEQNISLIEEIVSKCFVNYGMIADVNMHYDNPNNPHAHVMLTLRKLVKYDDGRIDFGLKQREWNSDVFLRNIRANIANITNQYLAFYGHHTRVSHLSHVMRGIDIAPTAHIGPSAKHMKNLSDRMRQNAQIIEENYERIRLNPELVLSKLSINKPVFTSEEIARSLDEALSYNVGCENLDKDEYSRIFEFAYSSLINSKELTIINNEDLNGDILYGLTKRIALENRYEEKVRLLASSNNHSLLLNEADVTINLSEVQKDAISSIITGPDISILEGIPGSGKTFIMGVLAKIYKKAGYKVIGAAPSSAASINLESSSSITSRNVTLWRKAWQEVKGEKFDIALPSDYHLLPSYNNTQPAFSSNTILIIDEASMGELINMDYLLSEVIKAKAKVIYVGDNNQYQAVGFQGALNKAISICGSFKLTNAQRQIKETNKVATKLISEYKLAEAVGIYKKENAFRIKSNKREVISSITRDYVSEFIAFAKTKQKKHGNLPVNRFIAVVSHSNESVDILNREIRRCLTFAGNIKGKSYQVRIGNKILELAIGDQIVFKQNDKHTRVLNGELASILSVKPLGDDGRALLKILVHSAEGVQKKIEIDTALSKYLDFNYGYAVTGYTLQGGSAEKVFVNFEPEMASFESFNVMMTRHRSDVYIYASKEELENIAYRNLSNNTQDARSKFAISMKNASRSLWESGFISSISKRSNVSFAKDHIYDALEFSKEDKVIKAYLESRSKLVLHVKALENNADFNKDANSSVLWSKISKFRSARDKYAKIITKDYDLYKERITQLGINYETLLRHSGDTVFGYSIEQKYHANSIAKYPKYSAFISILEVAMHNESHALDSYNINILTFLLTEIQDYTQGLKFEINILEQEKAMLQDTRYTALNASEEASSYISKLFPEFLSIVYRDSPKDVISKYHSLLESNNNDAYITSRHIAKNPEILGNLRGLGFGAMLKLNSDRKDAILNLEVLQERFKQYRDATGILRDNESALSNYENTYHDLTRKINDLKQNIPNAMENRLLEGAAKILNNQRKEEDILSLKTLICHSATACISSKSNALIQSDDINKDMGNIGDSSESYVTLMNSLNKISMKMGKSKSPKILFELIKQEQMLLANEYHNLCNDHYKDNMSLATRIREAHDNRISSIIQDFTKSFELVTKNNLITSNKLVNYLSLNVNNNNIQKMHDYFIKTYQNGVIKQINYCLDIIHKQGSIDADGKIFHSQKSFLSHIIKANKNQEFYPTTSIEKTYNKLVKDMVKIEHQKMQNRIEM